MANAWMWLLLLGAVDGGAAKQAAGTLELPPVARLGADAFGPVVPRMAGHSVVQLGASMAASVPLAEARFALVEALRRDGNVDVLLWDGGPLAAWTAMESLLRLREPVAEDFQRVTSNALPEHMRSAPYVSFLRGVRAELRTGKPLYVASVEVPAHAAVVGGNAFKAFVGSVASYLPMPGHLQPHVETLTRLVDGSSAPPDVEGTHRAINALEDWLLDVAPVVAKAHPLLPQHGRMLALVPGLLRTQLEAWRMLQAGGAVVASHLEHSRAMAVMDVLQRVTSTGHVVVWAGNDHVFHHSGGVRLPSAGQDLKRWLGDGLYTVGGFVPVRACTTRAGKKEDALLEDWLGRRFKQNAWVELGRLPADTFMAITAARQECGGIISVSPERDMDAVLFVSEVAASGAN